MENQSKVFYVRSVFNNIDAILISLQGTGNKDVRVVGVRMWLHFYLQNDRYEGEFMEHFRSKKINIPKKKINFFTVK